MQMLLMNSLTGLKDNDGNSVNWTTENILFCWLLMLKWISPVQNNPKLNRARPSSLTEIISRKNPKLSRKRWVQLFLFLTRCVIGEYWNLHGSFSSSCRNWMQFCPFKKNYQNLIGKTVGIDQSCSTCLRNISSICLSTEKDKRLDLFIGQPVITTRHPKRKPNFKRFVFNKS